MNSFISYFGVQASEQHTVLGRPELHGQYGRLARSVTPQRSTLTVMISSSSVDERPIIRVFFP